MSTVAVCDTEPIAIEGLRCLLESRIGLRLAPETSVDRCLEMVRETRPILLVMDRAFGAQSLLDCLRLLKAEQILTPVVVWGSTISESEALRYVQAGAGGVVRKTASTKEVLTCIQTVLSGATWMEYSLLPHFEPAQRSGRSALTAREQQVMDLVERGMRNKEIGEALGIQTGTVKIHLKHIFEKTGIRGRYGLALNGLKQKGLVA